MDEQNQIIQGTPHKSKLWKFFGGLVLIVTLAFSFIFGLNKYQQFAGDIRVSKLADVMDREEKDNNARELADTYGGKTPQETLAMYISAVEKGDYVLASKYFTLSNQKNELDSWDGVTKETLAKYVGTLKQGLTAEGSYSYDNKEFTTRKPILIDYFLYPSGVWKIREI
ncbi:MAG: hypothetical protein NTZ36_03345 [Candidatus Jorgensenbacteria bacterium]|nr:hypothetical protein [Candidatus Jorgensenbacteria bacterium]